MEPKFVVCFVHEMDSHKSVRAHEPSFVYWIVNYGDFELPYFHCVIRRSHAKEKWDHKKLTEYDVKVLVSCSHWTLKSWSRNHRHYSAVHYQSSIRVLKWRLKWAKTIMTQREKESITLDTWLCLKWSRLLRGTHGLWSHVISAHHPESESRQRMRAGKYR